MFAKIDRISCCFVRAADIAFLLGIFIVSWESLSFVDARQLPILFFLNLCFVEIIIQGKLFLTKNLNPDKLILTCELFTDEQKLSSID